MVVAAPSRVAAATPPTAAAATHASHDSLHCYALPRALRCDCGWHRPGNQFQDVVGAYASLDPTFWTTYHTYGLVGGGARRRGGAAARGWICQGPQTTADDS